MIVNIIPTPKRVELFAGTVEVPLAVDGRGRWAAHARTLADALALVLGRAGGTVETGTGIRMEYDASLAPDEYRIDSRDGILLSASDEEGLFYAMASLLLAMQARGDGIAMERALIEDRPDKPYRALLVDLARAWHPARTVHQYIELCFLLKIRYLHLHFVDDHGYTLPSRVLPHVTDG